MPNDVRCLVDLDGPYALVRLVGVLDPTSTVNDRLLTYLADRPGSVIIDVSGLRVVEPAALSVLVSVVREVAGWPSGEPLWCGADPALVGVWKDAGISVSASLPEALAQLGEPSSRRWHGVELLPAVGAARQARELVTGSCARWDQTGLVEPATIVVTEMVNNVVAHAGTAMCVQLASRDAALHIAVRDYSPRQPTFGGPVPPTSAGGRGLLLIDNVARRWGSSRLDDGKIVWAVLDAEDEPSG